jgi:hypothetical protein
MVSDGVTRLRTVPQQQRKFKGQTVSVRADAKNRSRGKTKQKNGAEIRRRSQLFIRSI